MIRRLFLDRSGTSAVEFAICLPFLILLYIGGYQLVDGLSAYRKVTATARTVADLTSQFTTVNDADLDTILNVSQKVMAPYRMNSATMTISQIRIDAAGLSTVEWSRGKNSAGLTVGSNFMIPAGIRTPNTWLIVASLNYNYVPNVGATLIGTIPMRDQIILNPRATARITKT